LTTTLANLIRLARPHQWAKGAFVVIGPAYGIAKGDTVLSAGVVVGVIAAFFAFGFASSACYIFNDIRDREADRAHPRKRNRPIASGAVPVPTATRFAALLILLAGLATGAAALGPELSLSHSLWLGVCILAYLANTNLYSVYFKHAVVLDVISLATGFVLRVLGGCAATAITPSPMLLNVTFFLAMFLAFGKRLGERRTMGHDAAAAGPCRGPYTDELLRMAVVVTGVATLITYAGYVQEQGPKYERGFNLLWLTMLPATYGLLRCIVLLERGAYDDPTELASRDRPMQAAALIFGALTVFIMLGLRAGVGRGGGG
jgi:decaprenyl-phosphate phosphoribosyltransferase